MEKIKHFSHDHPLKFYSTEFIQTDDPDIYNWCGACYREIDTSLGGAYGCRKCKHFIHKSCGELPLFLKDHPFHPHHTLFLSKDTRSHSSTSKCNACGSLYLLNFAYSCSECVFFLDIGCASLSPTNEIDRDDEMMHLIDSPHPLIICDMPDGYNRSCSCCGLDFSDSKICVCIECSHVLHESCASLKEIIHPFHIQHPLTLVPPPQNESSIKCNACSSEHYRRRGIYMFQCRQCDFALDFWCAALVPTSERIGFHQVVQKRDLNHKHPLIECNYIKEFQYSCRSCHRSIEGSIFVCLDCGVLLDNPCADLPLEVKHPCHPQHPFQLNERGKGHDYECWLCGADSYSAFAYSCSCNFHLEPSCALKKPSIINCAFHEHPIAYFSDRRCYEEICINCNECNVYSTEEFLLCVECRYSIHLRCCPNLPPIIKHSCHSHPLTLTYSKLKDAPDEDDDDAFYCNACKELRYVHHPTYYCEECHFVVHPRCVASEILLYMERGSTRQSFGNVKLDSSLNYVQDGSTVRTASSTMDKLEKLENIGIKVEAKEESCSHKGKYGVCSTPSILNAESSSQPLYSKVANLSLSSSHLQELPGFTRSVYNKDFALITPESHVPTSLPDWANTLGAYLISLATGSHFVMYLAKMKDNSESGLPPNDVERFIFVVQGISTFTDASGSSHKLIVDSYAYFPPNFKHSLKCDGSATLVVFERRYSYLEDHMTELIVGSTDKQPLLETPGEIFKLRKLLPTSLPYDFNIHIIDFQPGEFLNLKEVHSNEQGLLLLEGQGVYRLGDNWYSVQACDAIWMAPFVPQWYAALGNTRTRYLLYKDVNRNPL